MSLNAKYLLDQEFFPKPKTKYYWGPCLKDSRPLCCALNMHTAVIPSLPFFICTDTYFSKQSSVTPYISQGMFQLIINLNKEVCDCCMEHHSV